jgi:hypothetical protein
MNVMFIDGRCVSVPNAKSLYDAKIKAVEMLGDEEVDEYDVNFIETDEFTLNVITNQRIPKIKLENYEEIPITDCGYQDDNAPEDEITLQIISDYSTKNME